MYCSVNDIIEDLSFETVMPLVNDENLPLTGDVGDTLFDLTDTDSKGYLRALQAIIDATEQINGYLPAPVTGSPGILVRICKDISAYNLYSRRFKLSISDSLQTLYDRRISELRDIQKGIIKLNYNVNSAVESTGGYAFVSSESEFKSMGYFQ
jgi:phage gp36-like protein